MHCVVLFRNQISKDESFGKTFYGFHRLISKIYSNNMYYLRCINAVQITVMILCHDLYVYARIEGLDISTDDLPKVSTLRL